MRFDGRFQRLAAVSIVVMSLLAAGCRGDAGIDSLGSDSTAQTGTDPFDVAVMDDYHEPPPLIDAIDDGDFDRVRELLAAGEDVNQHDPVYGTPLIAALQAGDDDIVAAVLQAGANRDGTTAYFLAAAELPRKTLDPAVRVVADAFAESNELTLREHETLPALLLFDVAGGRGQMLVEQHQAELIEQGWFLFRFANDPRRRQEVVGLLPTTDKYVVLAYLRTDGLNYNITTERIIDWLKRLEREHPFVVTEVGLDYVGGEFLRRVRRPGQLAERMYAFCPDIVDQGVGSVANLQQELAKPAPPLYLWWD